jgi:hypothetical protein
VNTQTARQFSVLVEQSMQNLHATSLDEMLISFDLQAP